MDTLTIGPHPEDPNLSLLYDLHYNGMQLVPGYTPFVYNYLKRIDEKIRFVLIEHKDAIAIRLDLRIPDNFNWQNQEGRPLFNKFIDSLKLRIKAYAERLKKGGSRFQPTCVHFVWCREFNKKGKLHYHCVLFFSKQTFRSLGELGFKGKGLYGMISKAWCSAVNCPQKDGDGLIFVPKNALYRIEREKPYNELFKRASYLAKYETKAWGLRSHNFGSSRPGAQIR